MSLLAALNQAGVLRTLMMRWRGVCAVLIRKTRTRWPLQPLRWPQWRWRMVTRV